jgi:lysophospholipase L1-like esterase
MTIRILALMFLLWSVPALAGEDPAQPFPRSKEYPWMSVASWQERHQRFLKRAKEGGIELLFVGDSITEGWGGAGRSVWEKEYAPLKAANLGIGGDTTQNVLWRLANGEIDGLQPRAVVLMIGTNNFGLHGDKPVDVVRGITAVVASLRQRLPAARILVLGIFPRDAKPSAPVRSSIATVNDGIAKLADGEQVFYRDLGAAFTEPDGSLAKEVMPDALHLSPEGYRRWAEAMREPLAAVLEGK